VEEVLMKKLAQILWCIDMISLWTGKVVSFAILPLILFIVADVLLRYIFLAPTEWAHELGYFMFGISWMVGGAYALQQDSHVKMEVLRNRLPIRGQAILDLITVPVFFAFIGVLAWKGWEMSISSITRLEHSNSMWSPPIYPIKVFIPIGAFLLALQGLAKFIRDLILAVSGREVA